MKQSIKIYKIPSTAAIASVLAFYRKKLGQPVEIEAAQDGQHFVVQPVRSDSFELAA